MKSTTIDRENTSIEELECFVADIMATLEGEIVSQSSVVDMLLDLWNATTSHAAREVISEGLRDVQHVTAVRADDVRDIAAMACLAADVDSAFDHLEVCPGS
ncbi:MAG: hypothetical protein ACR2PK_00450 [Acidimicrobiales bacterium]